MKISRIFKHIGSFFKRNAYYVILFVCIAGIATMITLAAISGNNGKDTDIIVDNNDDINNNDDDTIVVTVPILFAAPVADYELGMEYSGNEFMFFSTLKEWRTHNGLDFKADTAEVLACYDGTVESVTTNANSGSTVIIKHNDDLKSVYKSLSTDVKVIAGDRVAKGDVIGYVSDSFSNELSEGAHLHFEVIYQNNNIDPMEYLDIGGK